MSSWDDVDNESASTDMKPHSSEAANAFFDKRNQKAREIAIFLAENKIWQRMLSNCLDYSGVRRKDKCEYLHKINEERMKYFNSNFNPVCRPQQTPGLPDEFEFKGYPKFE